MDTLFVASRWVLTLTCVGVTLQWKNAVKNNNTRLIKSETGPVNLWVSAQEQEKCVHLQTFCKCLQQLLTEGL